MDRSCDTSVTIKIQKHNTSAHTSPLVIICEWRCPSSKDHSRPLHDLNSRTKAVHPSKLGHHVRERERQGNTSLHSVSMSCQAGDDRKWQTDGAIDSERWWIWKLKYREDWQRDKSKERDKGELRDHEGERELVEPGYKRSRWEIERGCGE